MYFDTVFCIVQVSNTVRAPYPTTILHGKRDNLFYYSTCIISYHHTVPGVALLPVMMYVRIECTVLLTVLHSDVDCVVSLCVYYRYVK
jgi:hypothetical protein